MEGWLSYLRFQYQFLYSHLTLQSAIKLKFNLRVGIDLKIEASDPDKKGEMCVVAFHLINPHVIWSFPPKVGAEGSKYVNKKILGLKISE